MMPVISATTAYTPPPVIVATTIPGNNTLRVPPANVSPPVSNVQVDNNARGNNAPVASPTPPSVPQSYSASFSSFIANFDGTPTTLSLGAQTTFLAQLIGQDSSAQTQNILTEYENLVRIAQVKYKPSNAQLPEPAPSNLFGKLLQEEAQAKALRQGAGEQLANASVATQVAASAAPARPAPPAAKPAKPANEATESSTPQVEASPQPAKPRAIVAYQATIRRNDSGKKESPESI